MDSENIPSRFLTEEELARAQKIKEAVRAGGYSEYPSAYLDSSTQTGRYYELILAALRQDSQAWHDPLTVAGGIFHQRWLRARGGLLWISCGDHPLTPDKITFRHTRKASAQNTSHPPLFVSNTVSLERDGRLSVATFSDETELLSSTTRDTYLFSPEDSWVDKDQLKAYRYATDLITDYLHSRQSLRQRLVELFRRKTQQQ